MKKDTSSVSSTLANQKTSKTSLSTIKEQFKNFRWFFQGYYGLLAFLSLIVLPAAYVGSMFFLADHVNKIAERERKNQFQTAVAYLEQQHENFLEEWSVAGKPLHPLSGKRGVADAYVETVGETVTYWELSDRFQMQEKDWINLVKYSTFFADKSEMNGRIKTGWQSRGDGSLMMISMQVEDVRERSVVSLVNQELMRKLFFANEMPQVGIITERSSLYRAVQNDDGIDSLPLRSHAGEIVGFLVWEKPKNGDQLVNLLRPILTMLVIPITLLLLSLLNRAQKHYQRAEEQRETMERLAHEDPETKLPNARALDLACRKHNERAHTSDSVAHHLLIIELQNYKYIEDTFGDQAVLDVIGQIAARLQGTIIHGTNPVFYLGSGEFGVLVHQPFYEVEKLASNILALLHVPVKHHDLQIIAHVNIGCAQHSRRMSSAQLIEHARTALYAAKKEGVGLVRWYNASLHALLQKKANISKQLPQALENGEFFLTVQPYVSADTHEVKGVEVLTRWSPGKEERHPIPPDLFISIAEESGMIIPLTNKLMHEALTQMREHLPVRVSFNISPLHLLAPDFIETVEKILAETGFPAEYLDLEITEGIIIHHPERAHEVLGQLRRKGIHVTLDDFGVGYASIAYLQKFEFDRVKLDQSFLYPKDKKDRNLELFHAMANISKALNLSLTVEGVEKDADAKLALSAGATYLQGYLFAKPMHMSDFKEWVASRSAPKSTSKD